MSYSTQFPSGRKQSGIGYVPTGVRTARRPSLGPFAEIDILPEKLRELSANNPHYVYASPKPSILAPEGNGYPASIMEDDFVIGTETQVEEDLGGREERNEKKSGTIERIQEAVNSFIRRSRKWIQVAILVALLLAYHAWLVLALTHDFEKAYNMFGTTIVAWLLILYFNVFKPSRAAAKLEEVLARFRSWLTRCCCSPGGRPIGKIVFSILIAGLIAAFLIWDTAGSRGRLMGLAGMAFFIAAMWIFSTNPTKVNWRPILVGLLLQFIMAMAVLRWDYGARKFNEMADLILAFLDFTKVGTDFLYGFTSTPPNICGMTPVLAFSVVQVVIYFGAVVSLLYYYGAVQFVLKKMAWMMQLTMGTTPCESLYACSCMFLGMAEAPLLIRPYLEKMTVSELHSMMTTGFGTIAGAIFATYISFGACPRYLFSACIMSAPGSLVCSKLLYPECEKSNLSRVEDLELPRGEESSPLEAVSNGAVAAVEITLAIFANIVAFLGLLALINAAILYFGQLVGVDGWSLQAGLGYLLYPVVYLMGVTSSPAETMRVAGLVGTKIMLNEFIAYQQLGQMVAAGQLSPHSAMIATYALCSFSNFGAVGMALGTVGAMMPKRKSVLAQVALRSLCGGAICCLLTASLAGVLVDSPIACKPSVSVSSAASTCFDLAKGSQMLNSFLGGHHGNITGNGTISKP